MSSRAYEVALLQTQLEGVAEEMGRLLARSAFSANIRERLDFSCAVFSAEADLLAQAAHIPVHLGSLPDLLREIHHKSSDPGDCWLANSPFCGGTHLPDLTLVQPVFRERQLMGYVANRAHHADVGGMTPGSMPNSSEVYQEGLIIPPTRLFRRGRKTDLWEILLANVRTPLEREGDLRAQVAACRLGERRLKKLDLRHHQALMAAAEQQMADLLTPLGDCQTSARLEMDWGNQALPLNVCLQISEGRVRIDLRDCCPAVSAPINATRAITCAAAYFPFFCLAHKSDTRALVNSGSLRRLEVLTTPGTLLHATAPSPVCAGNVETSQWVCALIFQALAPLFPQRISAQSAFTMNNLSLGNSRCQPPFSYYETCGGGHGAGPSGAGASGQQVAMTNTRNTPAEVLETYYPLRLWSYRLRPGSGGHGQFSGGLGVQRELELLQEAHLSLLATHRRKGPQGQAGGRSGSPGQDLIQGARVETPWSGWLPAGARVVVHTPGGGGWGPAS